VTIVQASSDPSRRCSTVFIQRNGKLKNHQHKQNRRAAQTFKDRAARRRYRPVFRAFTSPLDLPDEMQEACQFYCNAQNSGKTITWNKHPLLWANFPQGENSAKNRQ
jgi:hypothetical protein